jgi:N-acetylmuramidase
MGGGAVAAARVYAIQGQRYRCCRCGILLEATVEKNPESEGRHFVKPVQDKDWAAFARAYNGPYYAANRYDTRLFNGVPAMGVRSLFRTTVVISTH